MELLGWNRISESEYYYARENRGIPSFFIFILLIFFSVAHAQSPVISYIIPDIGAPNMNSYVEIIGPNSRDGNFGADGIYLNNTGDSIQVTCLNPADTDKIKIGPTVVSWNGKMISVQIFVLPNIQPNTDNWKQLDQAYRIPIHVIRNNSNVSNVDTFYVVQPQPAIVSFSPGVIGSGGAMGFRSRRGAMIVDGLTLNGNGTYTIDTSDCDPETPGNQGYLPITILSKGAITGTPISADGNAINGGAGGGGGGGAYNDSLHIYPTAGFSSPGGNGYTGGEGGVLAGGEGTGGYSPDSSIGGKSLNSMPGGADIPGFGNGVIGYTQGQEGTGGGSGFPFGVSGQGGLGASGEYGGGGGADQGAGTAYGGGGAGNASAGTSTTGGAGFTTGNSMLVPLCGGSGGAGGNPYHGQSGYGGGGGGAMLLYSFFSVSNANLASSGADGGDMTVQDPGFYSGAGGGGSGGGIITSAKLSISGYSVTANGGSGGIANSAYFNSIKQNGGAGGAGRIRTDGPQTTSSNIQPGTASQYRGPSTDTTQYVKTIFTITGTGNGNPINIYLKPERGAWRLAATVSNYTNDSWTQQLNIAGSDTVYFLAAAQEALNPNTAQYTREPQWVLSQAAANILIKEPSPPIIASSKFIQFDTLICDTARPETLWVHNFGYDTLILSSSSFAGANASDFSIVSPAFPTAVASGDSIPVVILLHTTIDGSATGVLSLINNDPQPGDNPWIVSLNGIKGHIGVTVNGARGDTLNFGDLACNISKDSTITLVNTSTVPTTFALQSSNTSLFTVVPNIFIDSGGQQTITLHFAGASAQGVYIDSLIIIDSCGKRTPVILSASVDSASLVFTNLPNDSICPNEVLTRTLTVRNISRAQQKLIITPAGSGLFSISSDSIFLSPGDSVPLSITFQGTPIDGAYSAVYNFTDNCGIVHPFATTVTVLHLPSLQLSLQSDTGLVTIGDELKVYVVANSPASVTTYKIQFTVSNEPTSLQFDTLITQCAATYQRFNSYVTVTMSNCPQPSSDTIAVLYYKTLVGYTDSPSVTLSGISTVNPCDTVGTLGGTTVSLTLPGCDLGQAILTPYSSSIVSVYPNPANETASLSYSTVENATVIIALCDPLGRVVQTLVNAPMTPGQYNCTFALSSIPNGVYFITMREGLYYGMKELMLLK